MKTDHIIIDLAPNVSIYLAPGAVQGIILLGVVFYLSRLSSAPTGSQCASASTGCAGFLAGCLYRLLSVCVLILGLDQILLNGDWIWVRHEAILRQIGEGVGRILLLFAVVLQAIATNIRQ